MSKEIELTRGKVTIVDDEDYSFLMQWNWYARSGDSPEYYATRSLHVSLENGKYTRKAVIMHRVLTGAPNGYVVDHINGDTLDNRKSNLRVCRHANNIRNMRKSDRPLTSPYTGVSYHKKSGKWQASIKTQYKQKWLGNFIDPVKAAKAYNVAAIKQHGQFARLNEV